MTQTATAYLNEKIDTGEYFYCQAYRCTMSKKHCLKYQKQGGVTITKSYVVGFNAASIAIPRLSCRGCIQGQRIKEEKNGRVAI